MSGPRYLTGRGLLRQPRNLPPHEKGLPGIPNPMWGGTIKWDDVHRATQGWLARFDALPESDRKRIQQKGK